MPPYSAHKKLSRPPSIGQRNNKSEAPSYDAVSCNHLTLSTGRMLPTLVAINFSVVASGHLYNLLRPANCITVATSAPSTTFSTYMAFKLPFVLYDSQEQLNLAWNLNMKCFKLLRTGRLGRKMFMAHFIWANWLASIRALQLFVVKHLESM